MHSFLRYRTPRVIPALAVAALLAVCCSSVSLAAGTSTAPKKRKPAPTKLTLGGTWSGQYSGSYAGTFTIHWKQSPRGRLSGTITLSNPSGTFGITGHVHKSAISFGAVGAGATYTGSVSGRSMSGSYMTGKGPGSWSAHKVSRG